MLLIKMYIPPLKHCFIGETSVLTAYEDYPTLREITF